MTPWAPEPDDVATILRARTYVDAGDLDAGALEGGFSENTRPTLAQVQGLIAGVTEDVLAAFAAGVVPEACHGAARRAATLKVCLLVELSYFPEQAEDASPYLQLRQLADEAMARLIAKAQTLELFGEPEPEEEPEPA